MSELPPFGVIQAALRQATETLAREVAAPTDIEPRWNDFEWGIARSVAALQGISGLLANRLRWRGPDDWRAFLGEQRDHLEVLHARVGATLAALAAESRVANLPLVPLKGAALRALGVHRPGERPMADIDVLVRAADTARIAEVLSKVGYEFMHAHPRHDVYKPLTRHGVHSFAEHPDHPLKFEVHQSVGEELPVSRVDITAHIWPLAPQAGINAYPSLAALLRHLLLHAAGNMRANSLRHIQLYDIAQIARRMAMADWNELIDVPPGSKATWWMFPPLAMAAHYFPDDVSAASVARLRATCPALLRELTRRHTLHDVSLTNLRIAALPGFEWSRTPLELAILAKQRALPAALPFDVASVAHPQSMTVQWCRVSRGKRLLLWLFTRPPRVETILSVRAALANDFRSEARA